MGRKVGGKWVGSGWEKGEKVVWRSKKVGGEGIGKWVGRG